jgi:PilZ domain
VVEAPVYRIANRYSDARTGLPEMKKKANNHRRAERMQAAMSVVVGGARGRTRDISASGMYLETNAACTVGSSVDLELDLIMPWGKTVILCTGKVVRAERRKNRIGLAVAFENLSADVRATRKPAPTRRRRAAATKKAAKK